jgi:hypothetical protein
MQDPLFLMQLFYNKGFDEVNGLNLQHTHLQYTVTIQSDVLNWHYEAINGTFDLIFCQL